MWRYLEKKERDGKKIVTICNKFAKQFPIDGCYYQGKCLIIKK